MANQHTKAAELRFFREWSEKVDATWNANDNWHDAHVATYYEQWRDAGSRFKARYHRVVSGGPEIRDYDRRPRRQARPEREDTP